MRHPATREQALMDMGSETNAAFMLTPRPLHSPRSKAQSQCLSLTVQETRFVRLELPQTVAPLMDPGTENKTVWKEFTTPHASNHICDSWEEVKISH